MDAKHGNAVVRFALSTMCVSAASCTLAGGTEGVWNDVALRRTGTSPDRLPDMVSDK